MYSMGIASELVEGENVNNTCKISCVLNDNTIIIIGGHRSKGRDNDNDIKIGDGDGPPSEILMTQIRHYIAIYNNGKWKGQIQCQ